MGAVLLVSVWGSSASAQDSQSGWGRLFPSLLLTSDYRSIDVRYTDTDLGFTECGGVNWCEAGVAATLQLDLWM
jgi:hypothetical protein